MVAEPENSEPAVAKLPRKYLNRYFPDERPIWRPRRRDGHQSERSATAGRRRDQLEPCRLVDDRCVSENLGPQACIGTHVSCRQ